MSFDNTMHIKGEYYPWDEVPGKMPCFLRLGDNGHIVAAALQPECNPDAPNIILVEEKQPREWLAERLCEQGSPIKVFLKRGENQWEYCGKFEVESYCDNPKEIHELDNRSDRSNSIFRVIRLRELLE